ncbi:MAG: RDD family protein [Propionibacteriaceae bacterium]|nr:RDD family protein [Propionibacteriaceae bacterium]
MTEPQPGWYPDPADAERQRYWAGDAWTAETRTATTPTAAPATSASADPYTRYAQSASVMPVYKGPAIPAAPLASSGPATTDGVRLAGWWWRVLAFILDGIVLSVVQTIYQPLIPNLMSGTTNWLTDALNAITQGATTLPSIWDSKYQLAQSLMISTGLQIVVACLYFGALTALFGATVGQLACGLRVVPAGKGLAPRRMPAGPIALRVLLQVVLPIALLTGGGFLVLDVTSALRNSLGSALTWAGLLYVVFNYLWPVWDPKRQCIHDKLARTQVVRPAR